MKVVEFRDPGGPEVLRPGERPSPAVTGTRVRVRVHSSGVNRADLIQRRGGYPAPPGEPQDVPGLEFAGEVVEVGRECRLRRVGDRVMGILGGGGYAEEVAIEERETIRVPEGTGLVEAGAIPEVFITAWDALVLQGGLRSGEAVLIHAVGSGVGTAGLQIANALGARTIGTSRTPGKIARAVGMGLDDGITAEAGSDWAAELRVLLRNGGVDVILDLVGGAYMEGNLQVLGGGGRWIVVGVPAGSSGPLDLRKLMGKRASIHGTVLRARPPEEKAGLAREFERVMVPLFERGLLRPIVDRTFPAERAADAHRYMEANETFGKVLLTWGGS